MKSFKHAGRLAGLVFALLAAPLARADYVWIETAGQGARVQVGELGAPQQTRLSDARAIAASGQTLALPVEGSRWEIPDAPAGDLRFSARTVDAAGTLEYLHARSGRQDTRTVNDLELAPTRPGGSTFRLYWKGEPVSASQVRVSTTAGWQKALRAAEDGSVTLDTPFPGLYVLVVSARMDGATVVDGRRHAEVRHTASLSFRVGE